MAARVQQSEESVRVQLVTDGGRLDHAPLTADDGRLLLRSY
jgi:hypothetical protein